MDTIDLKILDFLQRDSTLTAKELGNELSLSPTPIYERIKRLEKNGYIKKYVALLEPELLNKHLTVFMNISIRSHHKDDRNMFLKSMTALEEIGELYHTSGAHDFMAKVRFANIKEYRDFLVEKVAPIDNIADIDSQIVLEEIMCSTEVLLETI